MSLSAINNIVPDTGLQQSIRTFFESFLRDTKRKKTAFDETNAVK
jgi:hypothetical protein